MTGIAALPQVVRSRLRAPAVALAMAVLAAGCGGGGSDVNRSDVGTAERCPHREAYCPVDRPGVAWPERPADSPSGRFQIFVIGLPPSDTGEDWRFEVRDNVTGAIVLAPSDGLDGGLGLVVAWEQGPQDAVWVSDLPVSRWRPGPEPTSPWIEEHPGPEAFPPVVSETLASDPG